MDPTAEVEPASVVLLDEVPRVFALYRYPHEDAPTGVLGWVFALPGGDTVLIRATPGPREIVFCADLESAATRWAGMACADLVWVAERRQALIG